MNEKFKELRERAENALENSERNIDNITKEEILKIVQNLEIHQIELELQNEELINTQTNLKNSIQNYANLYEFAPNGYMQVDEDLRITECNLKNCSMLSISKNKILEKRFTNFIAPDYQDIFYLCFEEIKATKKPNSAELILTPSNDLEISVKVDIAPILYSDKYLMAITNISQLKFFEAENKKKELRAVSLLNAIPDLVFRMDKDGNYLDFKASNDGLYYRTDDLIGKNYKDILPEYLVHIIEENINLAVKTGNLQVFEYTLDMPIKGIHFYECRLTVSSGNEIIAIVRDITEKRKIEKTLSDKSQELQVIYDNNPGLISHVDRDLRYISVNKSYYKYFHKDDVIGKRIQDVLDNEAYEKSIPYLKKALNGESVKFDNNIKSHDGKAVSLEVEYIPEIVNGKVIGIFIIANDITERKIFEKELIKEKENAERASKSKSTFLANMSHEIRTPMTAILGFSEILGTQLTDPQLLEYIKNISNSGRTLLSLINDILDLSKIEENKLNIKTEPVSLASVIDDIMNVFSLAAEKKQLKLIKEIPENFPKNLLLDELRIRQLMFNLVGNAIKFTETGFITLKLKIFQIKKINKVEYLDLKIIVEDTGIGIPEKQLESIFDSFTQVIGQNLAKFGGTGLGLAIVKKIVQLMGGSVEVKSQLAQGSVFTITLPNIEITEKADYLNSELIDLEKIKFKDSKVLIVDDNLLIREVIKKFLSDYSNLVILEAVDGKDAIQKANIHIPDVILMDLRMPGMSGVEAIQIIKSQNETKHIPILVITATVYKTEEMQIINECEGVLYKPIKRREVLEKIINILGETTLVYNEKKINEVNYDFSQVSKDGLNNVLLKINSKLMERWNFLCEFLDMEEVKLFADEIISIGELESIDILSEWGKNLKNLASVFDINSLQSELQKFQKIKESIELHRG
ncbi:MAG: PAS domain-containing protein [Leptospiraceae bacterium]|nr:PAS domain-containing protein [Leptospiraceae bacterium]